MNLAKITKHPDMSVLQGPGADGKGNLLLKVGKGEETLILKLYRRRWPLWKEFIEPFTARIFLKKMGANVKIRFETERKNLAVWTREGFDVLRYFDYPLPQGIDPPGLWLEYCPGRLLSDVLRDNEVPWNEKKRLLTRLGAELGRRHLRFMELSEPSLVQVHATVGHILLYGDRMITFDLEQGFLPDIPPLEALAHELSGYLRSIAKNTGERFDDALLSFAEGCPSRDLLWETAEWGVHGKGLYRRIKRYKDRRKRPVHGKTQVLHRLLMLLRAS